MVSHRCSTWRSMGVSVGSARGFIRLCRNAALLALVCSAASGCAYDRLQGKLERTEARLAEVQRDNNRLENLLLVRRGELQALEKRNQELQRQAHELAQELRTYEPSTVDPTQAQPQPAAAVDPADETGFDDIEDVGVVKKPSGEIRLTLEQRILFPSGKDELTKEGRRTLEQIADVLASKYMGRTIRVEGHTDNVPVEKSKHKYETNWELSAERACTVLRALVEAKAIDPYHAEAVGLGAERPIADNDTDSGRRQNRRVEIVILPKG